MSRFDVTKVQKKEMKELSIGQQEGRILRVIELGVRRPSEKFKDSRPKTKLTFMIELSNPEDVLTDKEGKTLPRVAFHSVNISGKRPGNKHSDFTSLLEAVGIPMTEEVLSSPDFLQKFIGKAVTVNLQPGDDGKVRITTVGGVSARVAATVPALVADAYVIDFENPDPIHVAKLSDHMKTQIKEAMNYPGSKIQAVIEGTVVDSEGSSSQDETGIE